uniref:Nucleoprotein TPR-like isoform X5 n=1 Tax=Rhizophora mucronata TaxID=61149 RepID=A0A2P2MFU5_RHIMU
MEKVQKVQESKILPAINFSAAPLFFSEVLHSHFSPVNVFLPAEIEEAKQKPDKKMFSLE